MFPPQKQSSVDILQPAGNIYKSYKKNNNKSCISCFWNCSPNTWLFTDFGAQHESQTENEQRPPAVDQLGVPAHAVSTRVLHIQMLTEGAGGELESVRPGSRLVSNLRDRAVLLDSELVKPAEALSEVPAQRDGEDINEYEQSERVEQHHRVLQER